MHSPIILPAEHPLPAAQRVEFGAWCADKLREARALAPRPPMAFIQSREFTDEERDAIEHALAIAPPTMMFASPPCAGLSRPIAETVEREPWEFNLLQLKALLRK